MTKLKLYTYPHPVLKKKAEPVEAVDDDIRQLLDDMLETMYADAGVGLAAPQVGVSKRILVIDYEQPEKGGPGRPRYFVNPEIIWVSDERIVGSEGCLSVPGQHADVERYAAVKVRYLDYDGCPKEIMADDFLAIVLQHEIDHLDGILYIDRISRLKREMLLKKMRKEEKARRSEEE